MDMEFEKIKDDCDKVEINTTAAREHVAEIEQGIWHVKERSWCVISDLRAAGFQFLHMMIIVHCVYYVIKVINAVPAGSGTRDIVK